MAFPGIRTFDGDILNWSRSVANVLNNVLRGKINSTGSVTLQTSATSTTVNNPLCGINSTILLSPINATAAGVIATTSVVAGDGDFVITHGSAGSTRTFRYAILG